jgi:hypothetical protein
MVVDALAEDEKATSIKNNMIEQTLVVGLDLQDIELEFIR